LVSIIRIVINSDYEDHDYHHEGNYKSELHVLWKPKIKELTHHRVIIDNSNVYYPNDIISVNQGRIQFDTYNRIKYIDRSHGTNIQLIRKFTKININDTETDGNNNGYVPSGGRWISGVYVVGAQKHERSSGRATVFSDKYYLDTKSEEYKMRPQLHGLITNNSSRLKQDDNNVYKYMFQPMNVSSTASTHGTIINSNEYKLEYNADNILNKNIYKDTDFSITKSDSLLEIDGIYLPYDIRISNTTVSDNQNIDTEVIDSSVHNLKELFRFNSVTNNLLVNTNSLNPDIERQLSSSTVLEQGEDSASSFLFVPAQCRTQWVPNKSLYTAENEMVFKVVTDVVQVKHEHMNKEDHMDIDYNLLQLPLNRCSDGWETRWKIDDTTTEFNLYGSGFYKELADFYNLEPPEKR
jgi:hypothetical protein